MWLVMLFILIEQKCANFCFVRAHIFFSKKKFQKIKKIYELNTLYAQPHIFFIFCSVKIKGITNNYKSSSSSSIKPSSMISKSSKSFIFFIWASKSSFIILNTLHLFLSIFVIIPYLLSSVSLASN